jgi:hypothetical protein
MKIIVSGILQQRHTSEVQLIRSGFSSVLEQSIFKRCGRRRARMPKSAKKR